MLRLLSVLLLLLALAGLIAAAPLAPQVPAAAQPTTTFDAAAATDAWLATFSGQARARSDAYFEGGYWLILWDFLYGVAVLSLILLTGLSARIRDLVSRVTRVFFLRVLLYWAVFSVVSFILSFPQSLWESFLREHNYGLSNQTFFAWFSDQLVFLALSVVLGGPVIATLFVLVRRFPRTWHIWGTVVSIVFVVLGVAITPVFIAPLFNTYKPLASSPLKTQILSLAHASGIPASDVYEVDASKQTKRVSANVSGLFGTERITLNDNLLARCSPQAILSTMGHEMGHYVLHHIENAVLFYTLLVILFFAVLRWALERSLARWGERWNIRAMDDFAVIPLAMMVILAINFPLTPIENTFSRTQEFEADLYGINAARQPDGEAETDLLLGEYRKLDPGPIEEMLFFDHPSGRTRIYAAMRWKAENLCLFNPALPCTSQPAPPR